MVIYFFIILVFFIIRGFLIILVFLIILMFFLFVIHLFLFFLFFHHLLQIIWYLQLQIKTQWHMSGYSANFLYHHLFSTFKFIEKLFLTFLKFLLHNKFVYFTFFYFIPHLSIWNHNRNWATKYDEISITILPTMKQYTLLGLELMV